MIVINNIHGILFNRLSLRTVVHGVNLLKKTVLRVINIKKCRISVPDVL